MAMAGRFQHRVEKFVFNPLARLALRLGIAPRTFALLETTGRHSGQRRLTPVTNGLDGDVFWVVSSHGTDSNYVKNLVVNPNARVKIGRRWYSGTASVVSDDDALTRRRSIDEANGLAGRADAVFFHILTSQPPLSVRIDLERTP